MSQSDNPSSKGNGKKRNSLPPARSKGGAHKHGGARRKHDNAPASPGAAVRVAAARTLAPVLAARTSLNLDSLPSGVAGRDQGLYKALCFGVCRQLPRLDALAGKLLKSSFKSQDQDIHALLLLGLYQLLYMRIAPHAAVGETAGAARGLGKGWATGVLNACLRRFQREQEALEAEVDKDPAVALSHPQWLLDTFQRNWPDDWQAIAEANNAQAPMTLRVNVSAISRDDYLAQLAAAEIEGVACPFAEHGITLTSACDVSALPGFEEGLVSVQDEAAQLAGQLLAPAVTAINAEGEGVRLLDACTAPGGKLADMLERFPGLDATAIDIDGERLERVEETLERLELGAGVVCADASERDWWDGEAFDVILLDAPCSGSGVIRRHPDIKLLRRPNDIGDLARLQGKLLANLWGMLKPGGTLVYGTCSIITQENARVMDRFLAATPDAKAETIKADWGRVSGAGRQMLPQVNGHDGFYLAHITKASA